MAERGFENVYLLSGGIDEFLESYPDLIVGKNIPVVSRKKTMSKNFSSKIEVNRQPPIPPQSTSKKNTMLPSIGKKGGVPSQAQGFRYDANAKKRTGSAALNRNQKNQIFNDIPDGDSYVTGKEAPRGLKKNSSLGGRRHGSKHEIPITEKPGNVVINKDGMMYKERKLEKLNKDVTDKLTNAHGQIRYDHY